MVLGTSGLRFTKSGAVESPQVLQIRVTQRFPGRMSAGAPEPRRSLSHEECVANLKYFSEGMRGPRTLPCTALVISGADWEDAAFHRGTVVAARGLGYRQITLHASVDTLQTVVNSELNGMIDALGLSSHGAVSKKALQSLRGLHGPDGAPLHVSAVKSLNQQALASIDEDVGQFIEAGVARIVLTWPLVSAEPPPHASQVLERIHGVIQACDAAGVPVGVKGFPLCVLGTHLKRAWRSKNRFYVDAEHQRDNALLFFPEVIQLQKLDRCRQCAVSHKCDGAPPKWLELGITGVIEPVE